MDLKAIFAQRRANNRAGRVELPQAFRDKLPGLPHYKAEAYFRRYLEAVVSELVGKLPFLHDGETYVSLHDLMNKCGDFQHKGVRYLVWNEFKDIYPLVQVVQLGSNLRATTNHYEKNTRVRIVNEKLLAMMIDERSPEAVFDHLYEGDQNYTDFVPIDMANLARFIDGTQYELEKAEPGAGRFREKLNQSLFQATLVQKVGQYTMAVAGEAILPMVRSDTASAFGRVYFKGMNIQNVNKQVRSAIIGPHWQYDLNAAAFASKLYLYGIVMGGDNAITNTPQGSYTREYLRDKNAIRHRLARDCMAGLEISWEAKVKNVKNALTAIGFGAKTSGKTWMGKNGLETTALAEIIRSKEARDEFLHDPWVVAFLAEQQVMEDAILAAAEQSEGYEAMCEAVKASNSANGRVTRAGRLAYLYQHWETDVMDAAVAVLEARGIEVVARIHDAFVVRDRVPDRVMDDVRAAFGLRDYIGFDCEEVGDWKDAGYKRAQDEANAQAELHRAHIEEEQRVAVKTAALKRVGWGTL